MQTQMQLLSTSKNKLLKKKAGANSEVSNEKLRRRSVQVICGRSLRLHLLLLREGRSPVLPCVDGRRELSLRAAAAGRAPHTGGQRETPAVHARALAWPKQRSAKPPSLPSRWEMFPLKPKRTEVRDSAGKSASFYRLGTFSFLGVVGSKPRAVPEISVFLLFGAERHLIFFHFVLINI